jgi:hypothetical protein
VLALLIERDQLDVQPAAASIALQRQQLQSIVDDWSIMTDEDKKRVLQIIFSEIRADHTDDGLKAEFRPRPIWEPYVEAVLARQRQEEIPTPAVITSERKTGGQARGSDNSSARPGRAWVAPTGELSQDWLIAGVRDGQMQESVPNAHSDLRIPR